MHTLNAAGLLPLEEYQGTRRAVFPTMNSLAWFIRQHRSELLDSGAIVSPTGRKLIEPERFDAVVLAIGKRRAVEDAGKRVVEAPAG